MTGDRNACALGCTTRDGDPYPAPSGYRLCDRCITRLRETLAEIPQRWAKIVPDHALLRQRVTVARGSPGYASSAPGDVHVMALRDVRTVAVEPGDVRSALEVTHAWASRVRQWRDVRSPAMATVTTECATLLFNFDWIVREFEPDWLITLAGELADVRGQLRAATGERAPAVVGHCDQASDDGQPCGGELRLPADGTSIIRCPRCRERYDADELIRAYRAVQGERVWDSEYDAVPAAVVAAMVREAGIPCTSDLLWTWVRRGHIRRAGSRLYDVASIMEHVARRLVNTV